jgi:hypothetical protein
VSNTEITIVLAIAGFIISLIGGLLGLVVRGLASEIKGMHDDLKGLVSKEVCAAHREKIEGDINNLGNIVRSK